MKKWIALLMAAVCLFSLAACKTQTSGDGGKQLYFNAEVLEVGEQTLRLKVTEPFESGISADTEVVVSQNVVSADGCPEVAVGDGVRVVYSREVPETAPLRLETVFAIYKLDADGKVIAP